MARAAASSGVSVREADTSEAEQEAKKFGTAEVDYIYDQPPRELLDGLLRQYVTSQIYHALIESSAAEQAARMTAMDAATSNASEMIDSLTLTMNRVRQAAITKEIIEIVSGAAALLAHAEGKKSYGRKHRQSCSDFRTGGRCAIRRGDHASDLSGTARDQRGLRCSATRSTCFGSGAAHWRRPGSLRGDGVDRGHGTGHAVPRPGLADYRPGGRRDAGPHPERHW